MDALEETRQVFWSPANASQIHLRNMQRANWAVRSARDLDLLQLPQTLEDQINHVLGKKSSCIPTQLPLLHNRGRSTTMMTCIHLKPEKQILLKP
jgi:hypothetical protein